jgi:exodeoxyribonuclease VII small subunit
MTRGMSKLTFEQAFEQLEQIVQEMESGKLSLENALQKFEEGIRLSRFCSKQLEETEKKITLLIENADGSISEKPFTEGERDIDNNAD